MCFTGRTRRWPSHPPVWPGSVISTLIQWHGEGSDSYVLQNLLFCLLSLRYRLWTATILCSLVSIHKLFKENSMEHMKGSINSLKLSSVSFSPQYLSCLSSSESSTDKLAFDVGLQEDEAGIWQFGNFIIIFVH